ncbi:flagellar hook-associated protein FlgK [Virgibacillus doumboii]|uniref:flagellar hook-associated protein FlgK n=1 Tax=Virgibacillus doumboii TaxID=2697503 RepID=UPI0013E08DA6|nr:flagellar hook-associated protein FlgK [Virgibacillus doumboii]
MSTFHGLEMAKQALFAQRSALYTTGHNISNANTEGYTRQRVNFETLSAYPSASRNRPEMPGQIGTGVEAGSVERIRNKFLDYQYRAENSKAEYWNTKADALSRMESLMNEPSENGLSKTMDKFWQSLQDLSVNPENSGARSVVAQRGLAVAETFNYLSDSLKAMRTDLKDQIDVSVKDANSILKQINSLNDQIKNIETNGMLPNDLYDERDRLIDELSGIVNIEVSYTDSSKSAPAMADGLATIKLIGKNGSPLDDSAVLVNGNLDKDKLGYNTIEVNFQDEDSNNNSVYNAVETITLNGENGEEYTYTATEFTSEGSLKGYIDSYGYTDGSGVTGTYTDMLNNLDEMAKSFVDAFNTAHKGGYDLNGEQGENFFESVSLQGAAGTIDVKDEILENPDLIAAAKEAGDSGDGGNASKLADVFDDEEVSIGGPDTTIKSFYQSIIGDMGVAAEEANRMVENSGILRQQVNNQRMSVSSVSLDEEMSNMIKFQHAYNAAARSMTAVDEMLNRVINNMGIVGR